MKTKNNIDGNFQTEEELKKQITDLQKKIECLSTTNQVLWSLFLDISRKMQVFSTAIKTSVSSLLGYDIILGASTQHEHLKIIDDSTDQVSKYLMLMVLIAKVEASDLILAPEPVELPELLSSVEKNVSKIHRDFSFRLISSETGKPVYADYEYLSIALVMLLELISERQTPSKKLYVSLVESKKYWFVDIEDINHDAVAFIVRSMPAAEINDLSNASLLSIVRLKLYLIRKIFELSSIQVSVVSDQHQSTSVRLMIPVLLKRE